MEPNLSDLDPLTNFEYNYQYMPPRPNPYEDKPAADVIPTGTEVPPANDQKDLTIHKEDSKEDNKEALKCLLDNAVKRKPRVKKSTYWSAKIQDKNFPFYGCTICNVSFVDILELDQHVTVHKGRVTSYDIRLKNQHKKKLLKKQQKLLKKLKKETAKLNANIEIKPEDGYIGTEKAEAFQNSENNSQLDGNNENVPIDAKINAKATESKPTQDGRPKQNGVPINAAEDPRLEKLYKCFACQKQFALSYYLKLHVRSHTDEKPYVCAECGQSFITSSKLGRHNKRIHLAIRYQCRICYRYFSRFEYLTRHFDKKHLDQKLEGEPYDYNAILPYLKELDELGKPETDEKVKTEGVETDPAVSDGVKMTPEMKEEVLPLELKNEPKESDVENKDKLYPMVDVLLEEDKFIQEDHEMDVDIKIKKEKEEIEPELLENNDSRDAGDSGRDESFSDEDYFPINTWASTPKVVMEPTPPIQTRKKYKKGDFPMQCEHCDKIINSQSYMKVHLRTHTGERPFKCNICSRGFITSSKMHRHRLTHVETWDDAEKVKEENPDIKAEEDNGVDHSGVKTRSGKKTKSKLKGRTGCVRKKEYQKRTFACPRCHKRFLHRDSLNAHTRTHKDEPLALKCLYCLTEQPDEDTLRQHEASHTGPKPYECTVCQRRYTKKETLMYHRKSHDPNQATKHEFQCDVCSKSFNASCKLQRHLVSHQARFALRYECPVCAHMFHTKYHVQMHLVTHQKEGLILEENRNEILAMVLQNARKIPKAPDVPIPTPDLPPDEQSRICNICGQIFQHFYYLEEHLKSHGTRIAIEDLEKQEVKKHVCNVCNKGFKLHYYLKLHSFTHTKEKPFICQQCGKGFITRGKLKRHLETHTGLKKYQCHICYKFFTRPSYLRIHVRTIHGTQDYNFRVDKAYMPYSME